MQHQQKTKKIYIEVVLLSPLSFFGEREGVLPSMNLKPTKTRLKPIRSNLEPLRSS